MSGYDPIAPIYDRYWGAFSVRRFFPVLERWLLPNLSPGSWVLDLGCGTGALAQRLTQRGYRVLGIDLSPGMIRQAHERLPAGRALVADMRALPLAPHFHAAYAVFASLNHLLTPEDLSAAFQSVARTLRPGGWFLFDLNTEDDYRQRWQETGVDTLEDLVLLSRVTRRETAIVHLHLTAFIRRPDGLWERTDTYLLQRGYALGMAQSLLEAAGFTEVRWHTLRAGQGQRWVGLARKSP